MRWLDPETWAEIASVAVRNPLRTGLTALGVFWGTLMLVLMLGFGEGLQQGVMRTMGGSATNAVYIWGRRTAVAHAGYSPGRPVRFRNADVPALASIPGVDVVSGRTSLGGYRTGTPVRRGEKTGAFNVMGDTHAYDRIHNVRYDGGRFIDPLDEAERRKVVVIGREVKRTLFEPHEDALGDWIEVRGVAFRVIGVIAARITGDEGDRQESTMHIPLSTFQDVFHTGDRISWFGLLAAPGVSAATVEEQARATLRRLHQVHPSDNQSMGSRNAEVDFLRMHNLFTGIRWLVWVVGAATLASGMVGVSNIMLIVVRERTSEIGLRRALGATPAAIVALIVGEAIALTAVSGFTGLLVGIAVIEAAAIAIGPNHPTMGVPSVPVGEALIAALLLVVAGAVAGFLPARRALAVHPVDALRAE